MLQFAEGERVEANHPERGWVAAKIVGVAEETTHIDLPGVNEGEGYEENQYRVMYLEGDLDGTFGSHRGRELRSPTEAT